MVHNVYIIYMKEMLVFLLDAGTFSTKISFIVLTFLLFLEELKIYFKEKKISF